MQLGKIERVIERNVALYEEMLSTLKLETEALKAHSIKELQALVESKNSVTARITNLESDRIDILKQASQALGIEISDITITKISEYAPPEQSGRLLALGERLKNLTLEVSRMNEFNRGIIEKLLRLNHESAINLQEFLNPTAGYAKKGMSTPPLKSGSVVRKTF